MGQSLSFLQGLIEKDPTNKALLEAYVDLCKKDADMLDAAAARRVEVMNNAANERINLIKQDVECFKKQSETLLGTNKALLDSKNPTPQWTGYSMAIFNPVQGLSLINQPPSLY